MRGREGARGREQKKDRRKIQAEGLSKSSRSNNQLHLVHTSTLQALH